jgi:signal transduction histidine kinase
MTPLKNEQGELVDFTFKTVNSTLAHYARMEPGELVGKRHNEVFPGSLGGLFQQYKKLYESSDDKLRFENHYQADGVDAWFDVLAKKRGDDFFITFLDFTATKKLQVELTTTADKLSTVFNTSHAGMFTLTPVCDETGEIQDFRFVIVNQAVAAYIDKTAENLAGALASNYFPAYKTNGLFDIYKNTLLTNTSNSFDIHYQDGYDVYFNIHTVKAGGEVLVTFTDQTSLKRLHHELENSIAELKHSNANLEEFAYAASHDLQEPLRKIHYFSERLRKGMGERLTEEETRMFERMENAAKRMSVLINDLLVYSQISTKKVADTTKVDLHEVVQQILNDLETSIGEKEAVFSISHLPVINGDPVQLRQLFQNIISNSLKYSKKEEPPVINISSSTVTKIVNGTPTRYHEVRITDNGIGFEQEHASNIFKIFQRLHGQSEFPGTGIGLAIVHKVIENHKGFISAQGRPGEGATFTILLPEAGKE